MFCGDYLTRLYSGTRRNGKLIVSGLIKYVFSNLCLYIICHLYKSKYVWKYHIVLANKDLIYNPYKYKKHKN